MIARPASAGLPRRNTPVLVTVPGLHHDLPSRVEDVRGEHVVIAAVSPGPGFRVSDGELLTLAWAAPPRGLLSTACVLDQVEASVPLLWVLRPVGVLRRLQRRRFARADVSARVTLSGGPGTAVAPRPEDGWVASGMLADLSEGGARVVMDAGQRVPTELHGSLVVDVRIGGRSLVTVATVVGAGDPRARPAPGPRRVRPHRAGLRPGPSGRHAAPGRSPRRRGHAMRFVPLVGLLMASPVVLQAVQGERPVRDALLVWLVAMVLAVGGVVLFRAATAHDARPADRRAAPRRRGRLRTTPSRGGPLLSLAPTLDPCWS